MGNTIQLERRSPVYSKPLSFGRRFTPHALLPLAEGGTCSHR